AAYGENRFQVCVEDLDRVMTLPANTPDDRKTQREALVLRGRAQLFGLRDNDHAIADLTRALDLDANQAEALTLRGIAHSRNQQYALATADCSRALKLAPRTSVYLANRGYALFNGGKTDDAIRDFTAAIAINPKYAAAYEGRAKAYEKAGDAEKGRADK